MGTVNFNGINFISSDHGHNNFTCGQIFNRDSYQRMYASCYPWYFNTSACSIQQRTNRIFPTIMEQKKRERENKAGKINQN